MTSQPGKQTVAVQTLPSISRSKSNQTIKFGRLIEHNMRNIFLEKSYTKYREETIRRPFSKKSKLSILLDSLKSYAVCFGRFGLSIYIETKQQTTCFSLI